MRIVDCILELAAVRQEIARLKRREKALCEALHEVGEADIAPRGCLLRVRIDERGRPKWKAVAVRIALLHWGARWRKPLAEYAAQATAPFQVVRLLPNVAPARKQPENVISIRSRAKGAR